MRHGWIFGIEATNLEALLPDKYKNASLVDIIDDLGVGYNTMIPDFLEYDDESDYVHRGLGLLTSSTSTVHKIKLHNVSYTAEETPKGLKVTYKTPFGEVL